MVDSSTTNTKYLSRCQYYGKLIDWDYLECGAMILRLKVFTATEYFGKDTVVRLYVPTDIEERMKDSLIVGYNYFVIAAPYRLNFKGNYRHRVDLLINIFQEV